MKRSQFIYLDNASTTFPKPEAVYKFITSFYKKFGVNPGRSRGYAFREAEKILNRTRERLTKMFNGTDSNRLVFTYNATDALNMVINGLVKMGDHVITTKLEHNSVLRPLNHVARDKGIEVDFVPFDQNGFVAPEDIEKKIKGNTRLVIVNHASNVIGTIQPIKEIGAICRKKGVVFAIDAAQTTGAIPIDIEKMNIDIVAFTGHKSLLGPMGIGGLYVREGIKISPTRFGGTGIRSQERFQPEDFPYCLECGTVNMVGVAGLYASLDYLNRRGLTNIHRYEMKLTRLLVDELQKIDRVVLYCSEISKNHLPLISFNIRGFKARDTGALLDEKYHIYHRAGLHCAPLVHEQLGTAPEGTVRFAIGPFNTRKDIETAIEAVRAIAAQ